MLNEQDDSCATDSGSPLIIQYYGGWVQTGAAIGTNECKGRIRFYSNLSKSIVYCEKQSIFVEDVILQMQKN